MQMMFVMVWLRSDISLSLMHKHLSIWLGYYIFETAHKVKWIKWSQTKMGAIVQLDVKVDLIFTSIALKLWIENRFYTCNLFAANTFPPWACSAPYSKITTKMKNTLENIFLNSRQSSYSKKDVQPNVLQIIHFLWFNHESKMNISEKGWNSTNGEIEWPTNFVLQMLVTLQIWSTFIKRETFVGICQSSQRKITTFCFILVYSIKIMACV